MFLTGPPGMGKTCIVNQLSNERNSIVDLRYHAFAPINPGSITIPDDTGERTTKRRLWGDLLSQMRLQLRGSLSEFKVPLCNDFLDTEQLRLKVIELSSEVGKRRGRPVVIAIDGIDHAARAFPGKENKFLSSLIPPDQLDTNVRFLIAGQPPSGYPDYPAWLRTGCEKLQTIEIAGIDKVDIEQLVDTIKGPLSKEKATLLNIIHQIAKGNTLSAVFAVHEASLSSSIKDFEAKVETRHLKASLTKYYDSIWDHAVKEVEQQVNFVRPYVGAVFALAREHLDAVQLSGMIKEIGRLQWKEILRRLQPLIICEDGQGFRLLHNDVRVYLESVLKSERKDVLKDVASLMAEYYCFNPDAYPTSKFWSGFDLLVKAGRYQDLSRVVTSEYVIEGFALGEDFEELARQVEDAIRYTTRSNQDWDRLHSLVCTLLTLNQLNASRQWSGKFSTNIQERTILPPLVLFSERHVPPKSSWGAKTLSRTLHEIDWVLEVDKQRGYAIVKRWFSDTSLEDIIDIFLKEYAPQGESLHLHPGFYSILELVGKISAYSDYFFDSKSTSIEEPYKAGWDAYCKGILDVVSEVEDPELFSHLLNQVHGKPTFLKSYEDVASRLASSGKWDFVSILLHKVHEERQRLSLFFQAKAAGWSIWINDEVLKSKWSAPWYSEASQGISRMYENSTNKGFSDLQSEGEVFLITAMTMVYGMLHSNQTIMQVQSQGIETFFKEKKRHKERCRQNLGAILYGAALAGTWLGRIRTLESVDETPFLSGFEDVIRDLLLLPDKSYHADPMGSFQKMQSHILQFIVCIAEEYSHAASKRLSEIFSKQVESGGIGFSTGNIWRFLEKNHQFDVLKAWLSSEIGPDAWMWSKDVRTSTRMENLEIFMELAFDSEVHECIEIAKVAKERGRWCWVGHVGHKDYSLLPIVDWLDLLEENNHDSLPQFKTDFDILSERVDKLGDNRVHRSQNTPERESNLLTIENPEQFLQENEAFLVEIERNVSEKKELSLDEQKKLLEIVNNFKLIDRLPQFSQSFIEIIKKDGWDYFWYFSGMTNVIEKLRGTNCESSLWELANMCMDYRDFSNTEAWLFALAQDLNSICLAASNSNEELEKGFLRLKQTYELWYTGCGKLI